MIDIHYLKRLKDYELKYLSQRIGHKSPGNKSNDELINFLLENKKQTSYLIEKLNTKYSFWNRNSKLIIPLITFLIPTILSFIYWQNPNSQLPELKIESEIPITILANEHGAVKSLTNVDTSFTFFKYFAEHHRALLVMENPEIDVSFFKGLTDLDVELKEPNKELLKQNPRSKDKLEYAIFSWLTHPPHGYPPMENSSYPIIIGDSNYAANKDITTTETDYLMTPHGENIILEYHNVVMPVPKGSKFYISDDSHIIETPTGKLKFKLKEFSTASFNYYDDRIVKNIYEIFSLDKSGSYRSENYVLNITYECKRSKARSKQAEIERDWVNKIIEMAKKEMSFEILRKKIELADI